MKKFALITGASGGIGRSIAKKLAEEGYSLYLHYFQNKEGMRELMRELSRYDGEFIPIQADLTSAEGYQKVVANVYSIDAIVHNCGPAHYGLLIDLEQETAEKLMRIHVISP
ncbi:MAG: SDR family NAD(P)-dependent oxidoreductase, partial [Bacillales bacterium]